MGKLTISMAIFNSYFDITRYPLASKVAMENQEMRWCSQPSPPCIVWRCPIATATMTGGITQPGDDIHSLPWFLDGPFIEIDGLPMKNMVDLSMAMLVITRWYIYIYTLYIYIYIYVIIEKNRCQIYSHRGHLWALQGGRRDGGLEPERSKTCWVLAKNLGGSRVFCNISMGLLNVQRWNIGHLPYSFMEHFTIKWNKWLVFATFYYTCFILGILDITL